jgi:hypothetical protein
MDKISGTHTAFRVDLGDKLACAGYTSCRIKYLDAAIETTGVTIKLTQLNSKDILFVNARLGQSSIDTSGLNSTLGYLKLSKVNASSSSTSGATHHARTPAMCVTDCLIPHGMVDFSLTGQDYSAVSASGIEGVSVVLQIEYF